MTAKHLLDQIVRGLDGVTADHERIWLQNANDAHGCEGRLWCQDKVWPECPEQGEPTEYVRADLIRQLRAENAMLQSRTHPNHVILIDGVGHYVNDSVKEAFGKLKAACAAVANASSYRMDIGAVETCRLLSKYIATTDGPTVRYNGTGEDYLRQALTNPTEDATVTEVSATDENALAARAISLWRESCAVEHIPSVDVLEGNIAAAIRAALTPPTKVEFCGCMAGPNDPDPKCSECGGTGKSGRFAAGEEWQFEYVRADLFRDLEERLAKAAEALEQAETDRAEQWRLRRDAEGSRDAACAAADSLRIERDMLRTVISYILEGWDFWQVNPHDREPPRDAIRRARTVLSQIRSEK